MDEVNLLEDHLVDLLLDVAASGGIAPAGRPVAVKVIRPEFAEDAEFRRRFRQEVQAAQRVQGLYTAPVIDSDAEGTRPWLATAFVPGPTLSSAVAGHGPLPVGTVLLLVSFGVVMVYSATSATALLDEGDPTGLVKRQVVYALLGLAVFLVAARARMGTLRRIGPLGLAVSGVLLAVVLVPGIGTVVNGSRRWIDLGELPA